MDSTNDKNQDNNLESTSIENVTGIENSKDLSNLDSDVSKEQLTKMQASVPSLEEPKGEDPPTKTPKLPNIADTILNPKSFGNFSQQEYNKTTTKTTTTTTKSPAQPVGDFLSNMAAISKPDTAISKPINQDIDYSKYKDYLPKNKFYYENATDLDKSRALNQSNWEQALYATGRTLVNVVPEAIKQVANAFDVEDWSNSNNEIGNFVADAMTSFQTNVKDAMPIYRENPNKSLDVGDFAYWMETGDSLVTSIGGFVLAGYATAGIASIPGKILNAAADIRAISIAKKVADGVRGSSKFQNALNLAKANQVGTRLEGLAVNFLLNQAESVGIGADVYKNVYQATYNKEIVAGKTQDEAKEIAKKAAAIGAAASINFNRLNMLLNTSSSQLFLTSPEAISGLIKKEGWKKGATETGKEALEEYINDLGQMYGEAKNTDTPLTFKQAVERLGTAEGIESPILGAIGGAGQQSLTKAGKYIQSSNNESYMRHFNEYLMNNPITETNKEASIQAATAYAQSQASKDKPMGLFTNKQPAGYTTSTAQQLESLYIAQQAALDDYKKASTEDKLIDVINSAFSAQFSSDLLNQIKTDDTLTPSQKNVLLERTLLSHQAYKSLEIGTLSELKNLYKTYTTMDEEDARTRGLLTNEKEGEPEHYKTKASNILKTLDVYETNYNLSKSFVNSTEVYDKLNNSYFNDRDVTEIRRKHDSKLLELDNIITNLYTQNNDQESLAKYKEAKEADRLLIPDELQGSKIAEEIYDLKDADAIARKKELDNTLELQKVTSDKYNKELSEYITLYRNKQIAEKNKASATKKSTEALKKNVNKAKEALKRKANIVEKKESESTSTTSPTNATTQQTTNTSSTTGNVQPTGTGVITPFDTSDIKASKLMQDFIDKDTIAINKILNSKFSLDTKISKLQDSIENKAYNDYQFIKTYAVDGEEVATKLVAKLQAKIKELQDFKENLAPDVKEADENFNADVTDFALDLEEENIDNPALSDETEEPLPFNKEVIDAKYDIYSSILEEMGKRGIDTSNYEEVMTEFKTILGTRLTKTQYNSLQALFNLANNTNESQSYNDLFDTEEDVDNDIKLSNKLAKVTLPNGKFVYDIDEESRIAMQNTRQGIILNNPDAEVKGLAYPIYNERGSNVLAYLSQKYKKVATKRVNKEGEEYYEINKITQENPEYYEIDKDILSNLLNTRLDFRILEDGFFNVGDTIEFLPLESYMDDDGNIVLAKDLPVEEKPIGVVHNGTLLDGVYLHNISWITAENLNNTPNGIEMDRASLLALRNRIINGENVKTSITEISAGAPITNPNQGIATFASQFEEFPVGIIRNGVLETATYNIDLPEYMHFNEGSVVTKVGDYFYYGSRTRLFNPMQLAITHSLKAYALGEHNDGTKAILNQNQLNLLTGKGLQAYISKLVNTASIKVNNSFPTDLETFKDALNTRSEDEVFVNIIKGDFYIGRGQGLDIFVIKPGSYKNNEEELDNVLTNIKGVLEDSFANVSLEGLKANDPLLIINEKGIVKTFPTYDNYIKHVSTSIYGSVILPSGNKITTIQKRINFDLPLIENKTEKLATTSKKRGRPKKIEETIKAIETSTDLFSEVTDEDMSPDVTNPEEVQYTLKAINILNSDKAKQVFEKGMKNAWNLNKILTELQIPKQQKELALELGIVDRELLALELASNYNYTVEINTTKDSVTKNNWDNNDDTAFNEFTSNGVIYTDSTYGYYYKRLPNTIKDIEITKEEYNEAKNNTVKNLDAKATQYYSNLTVPGGTNYTENEIATPLITPSIKGHAQFATDNGIGWFRSDDKAEYLGNSDFNLSYEEQVEKYGDIDSESSSEGQYKLEDIKTRRILEIQSDLFQKGRDKSDLVNNIPRIETGNLITNEEAIPFGNEPIKEFKDDTTSNKYKSNQFLQLLNKDNNWVTFFVKSIVQDSAKKGYEKVLFPSGNTAAKVEGHETLANEIIKIDNELSMLKNFNENDIKVIERDSILMNKPIKIYKIDLNKDLPFIKDAIFDKRFDYYIKKIYSTKEEAENDKEEVISLIKNKYYKDIDNKIIKLEEEKTNLKARGIEKLKPIENFYENTVTNILNKTYGKNNVKVITDEYGNAWNEITVENVDTTVDLAVDTVDNIYNELGNKTQSENVILPKDLGLEYKGVKGDYKGNFYTEILPAFKAKYPNGLVAYRGKNSIGNPFNWQTYGTGTSLNMFIDWIVTGNNYNDKNATKELRDKYISEIKNGKDKKILYYFELNKPSHATALDYLINKYDWNNNNNSKEKRQLSLFESFKRNSNQETNTTKINNSKLTSPSYIEGISNAMQNVIINDMVQDYYGLILEARNTNTIVTKLKDLFNEKVTLFTAVVAKAKEQNYKGYDKLNRELKVIKANENKMLEIVKQNLTRQLGIIVTDKNLIIEATNDEQNSREENVDAPEGSEIEDMGERERIFDVNEFSIDPKLGMSNEIKYLLHNIIDAQLTFEETNTPTLGADGKLVDNITRVPKIVPRKVAFQIPVRVNPNIVYQDLIKVFSKSSSNDGMDTTKFAPDSDSKLLPKVQIAIKILESLKTIQPYYANVITKLEEMDMQTQLQFINTFNKNNTDHITIIEYANKDGESLSLQIIKNSTQNATKELIRKWDNNLKSMGGYYPTDNKITLNPLMYDTFNKFYKALAGNKDLQTYANFQILFKTIGIDLPLAAFEMLRDKTFVNGKLKNINQQFEHSDGWFRKIKERLDFMMEVAPDGTKFHKDINILYSEKVFKDLATFLMKFDKTTHNTSFKDVKGDTIYGVTNNRYFMERMNGLKNNTKLLKNLYDNPFSSTSTWLNKLYNKDTGQVNKSDFLSDFSYETINGFKDSVTNKAKLISKMDSRELIKMNLTLFYNNGLNRLKNAIPVHRFVIPALADKTNAFEVQAQGRFYNYIDGKLTDNDLNFLRTQFFEGEYLRIINVQHNSNINVKGYNEGGLKFLMFPKFNDIASLWENGRIKENALDASNPDNSIEEINEVIMDYVNDGYHSNYNKWKDLGLLKEGKEAEGIGVIYEDRMMYIDDYYAKNLKENPKNLMSEATSVALNYTINYLVANANMQQLLFNDPAFYYKKGKMNEDKTLQVTSDIEETWDNASKRYAAVNGGKDNFAFPAGSTFSVLSIDDTKLKSNNHDYLSSLWAGHPNLKNVLDKNSEIQNGDAQEYTTLKEHLDRMVYSAALDEKKAKAIMKEYKETGKLSKVNLETVLIPFKPLYFNTYMDADGVMKTLYIKTSSLPLIKQFTKGLQIDALRDYLENSKNKVEVAVFASGIKAGNPIESLKLFDKDGNLDTEALKGDLKASIIRNIPRDGHGNQQNNPDKSKKTEINDGTQQAKLLFTNILGVLGFKNPFSTSNTDKEVSGRELSNMYLTRYEKRFQIQYNKLMKELDIVNGRIGNINKLKSILTKEAISKGWTFNEAASFELDESRLNFDIPLWMSISSTKIENLLSSIVDNRIRKRKRFGRSYILASDAGIRTFNATVDNKESGITFLDTFKGELKNSYNDNGEMVSADILVPFRFFDNNDKLLELKNFIKEDGTLDTAKLPIELLQGFGFRIPTSGINLMSNIRIVGFLPDSYGDVVIAPADFTIQMGSDFDVDKFYTNTYATYYNEAKGSLERLENKHLKARQVVSDTLFKLTNDLKRLKNYKGKTKDELVADNKESQKIQRANPLYKIKNLEVLILDNEILDIQRAVLNNPDVEVQRARTKPLSFGRLQEMVEKFGTKVAKEYYTFLDRNVQDENYINGNVGKAAVSNFSLDMILNSLGQYSTQALQFQYRIKTAKGYVYKPVNIKAFGFKNNNINNPLLNDGSGRYKSDVLEGLMAAALDNGKEKILGKLNINETTYGFIRAMVANGYNEEVIIGIINQPVVKMYLDPVTDFTVKFALQNAAYSLKNTSTNLSKYHIQNLQNQIKDYNINESKTDIIKKFEKAVVAGELVDSNLEFQISALGLFLTMDKNGQALAQVRSALSVDSTGVGKNTIYSVGKMQQADAAQSNKTISNVSSYFEKSIYDVDSGKTDKIYSAIGNSALTYGVNTNARLWSKYFPFDNQVIQDLITDIGNKTGKDIFRLSSYSDYATLVLKDLKSFLSAKPLTTAIPSFMKGMDTRDIHKSIVYSSPSHQSLGEFIEGLRKTDTDSIRYVNDLLNSLTIGTVNKETVTEITPAIVSIEYISDKRLDNNENDVVNSLIEMINEPVALGLWNGNAINSKDLANLLILHQMYSKGVPSSTKFIQYIPTTYLKQLGYYNNMSQTFSDFVNPTIENNIVKIQFMLQHLQHNMKDYYDRKLDNAYNGYFTDGVFTGTNRNSLPKYIVFLENGEYHVQYQVKGGFIRLNPLGWGDNTEYNHEIMNPISINFKNNINSTGVRETSIKDITTNTEIENTSILLPFTAQIDTTLGKKTTIKLNDGKEAVVYPIQLIQNGSKSEFYLTKNGNSYNSLYHSITKVTVPIEDLKISNTKIERDINIINALSILDLQTLTELGLTTEIETVNIKAIEDNLEEFMTSTRDKSEDIFPDEINVNDKTFADELGLTDKTLNLQDRYNLIFNIIQKTNGKSNPILRYFLANATAILPVISSTPIILDYNLKAKGMYKSNNEYGYIAINPNKFTSVEEMASVVAEEAIHALFKKQIKVKNAITKDLEKLRKEVKVLLATKYGQDAIDAMRVAVSDPDATKRRPLVKGVESDLLYSIHNLDEFIAAVLTKPLFQEYLNNNEINLAKKTIWQKVLELLSGILEALGVKKNKQLEQALGGILALTEDIKNNHLTNLPKPKYERSIGFINEKFNLVTDTNELSTKGNALEIAEFINTNFAGVKATVIEKDYVEVLPISFANYTANIDTNLSADDWSLESLEFAGINYTGVAEANKEIKANYYQYASSLRARIIQGSKKLRRLKAEKNTIEAELLNTQLLKDKVDLMSVPKLQNLTDFALKAKEDLDTANKILDNPMNSEDIVYVRSSLNFWKAVRDYTFTDKHKESNELMRRYSNIEDDAKKAITRLQLIEKKYLQDFMKETLGRDVNIDDMFKNYKDIWAIQGLVRDISTYDNELLSAIWKEINFANMRAEEEANTVLSKLNTITDKIMPTLKAINFNSPYEIFRQKSENGLDTNHLINMYSTKFYKDKGRVYNLAKEKQTSDAANAYSKWVKDNSKVIELSKYFEVNGITEKEINANREDLRKEIGDYAYNLWFNGQNRKINAYNIRREAIEAIIKTEFNIDLDVDIAIVPEALKKLQNWDKKHSPYEFSKIVNSGSYNYYDGSEGIDGFQHYEVLPIKKEHFNKDFEVIASDPDLMDFYNEFSLIYEDLKKYVPASQLSTLMYGGLPVIEKSIYQMFSTGGMKVGFKGLEKAWTESITSSYKADNKQEFDLVTEQNAKQMRIPGLTSNASFINNYVNSKSLEYEVNTSKLPTANDIARFREEAVDAATEKGDFDLGKLMKIFSTLVIAHKHISAIEDLVKISQYTINSYQESEFNNDGSKAFITGGTQSVLPVNESFVNMKKSYTYTINNLLYGEIKQEEGRSNTKLLTPEEKEVKATYVNSLLELQDKYDSGEVTEDFYNNLKDVIETNIEKLGSVVVASKVGDNWLKWVQLKLMGWNILGGFSNSAFGFIANMIEAAGEGNFTLAEMNNAYKMVSASVAKNLTFNKWEAGESKKIRNAMNKMNVMKEASHELYTSNESLTFGDKFKFASPYNMNQRTEYLNQAPIMIIYAKKTMINTKEGEISLWEGMDENWEWDTAKYGELPQRVVLDMRLAITKQIQRTHGNYDPLSPLAVKEKILGRALSQFRTWLYEAVAIRFEQERFDDGIQQVVKGRYRTLAGLVFENEARITPEEALFEFSKAMLNAFTFGTLKLESFKGYALSKIDEQNMRKVAMELVLLLDIYILIALVKAGLSDDDEQAKAMYNILLNQGTRLKSDLLLYVNPSETRNILRDIIPSVSLYDDIAKFGKAVMNLDEDEIKSGVHKGDSRIGTAIMKNLPFFSKGYSTYNASSQLYDKTIDTNEEEK